LTVVFIGIIVEGDAGKAGDDATSIYWIDLANIEGQKIAFDHGQILHDYWQWKTSRGAFWSTKRRNY
jgi:hypothetical protein